MSFNVGQSIITANISSQQLHNIKENNIIPILTLWEKIKHFFFSTKQELAFKHLDRLYRHTELGLSAQDIDKIFSQLRELAAPGCRHKFTVEKTGATDTYRIDDDILLSLPHPKHIEHDNVGWRDYHVNENIWYDVRSIDDREEVWYDCQDIECYEDVAGTLPSRVSSDGHMITAAHLSTAAVEKKMTEDELYVQSVRQGFPKVLEYISKMNPFTLGMRFNLIQIRRIMNIGKEISESLDKNIEDKQVFKKRLDELLNIPGLINLLPKSITDTPEFLIIKDDFAS